MAKTVTKKRYTIECSRCGGTGRYDRGTCFRCRGNRFMNVIRKPQGEPREFLVTYDNGKQNLVRMYFANSNHAIKAIENQMLIHGWSGTIKEL